MPDIYGMSGTRRAPPLPDDIGPEAGALHGQVMVRLKQLLDKNHASCVDTGFIDEYQKILDLFGQFQESVLRYHDRKISCVKGCSSCCFHWVADVYSFEAHILAAEIRKNHPERTAAIIDKIRDDAAAMNQLSIIATENIKDTPVNVNREPVDEEALLLAGFYQLGRPCPLIDPKGACLVYKFRPLTCRIYLSFSPAAYCRPDRIDDERNQTFVLDLNEEAHALLGKLHQRYDVHGAHYLRPLLLNHLA